jgi:TolA-binding protein
VHSEDEYIPSQAQTSFGFTLPGEGPRRVFGHDNRISQIENELLALQNRIEKLEEGNIWFIRQFNESNTEQQKVNSKIFEMLRGRFVECQLQSAKADAKAEEAPETRSAGSDSEQDPPVN